METRRISNSVAIGLVIWVCAFAMFMIATRTTVEVIRSGPCDSLGILPHAVPMIEAILGHFWLHVGLAFFAFHVLPLASYWLVHDWRASVIHCLVAMIGMLWSVLVLLLVLAHTVIATTGMNCMNPFGV